MPSDVDLSDEDEELIDYEDVVNAETGELEEEGEIRQNDETQQLGLQRKSPTLERLNDADASMIDANAPYRVELAESDLIAAESVRRAIEEPKGHLTRCLAKRLGGDALRDALKETLRIERLEGGSRYEEGFKGSGVWRERTRAGLFLVVIKKKHDAKLVSAALAESRAIDKAMKRNRRERFGGHGRGRGRGRGHDGFGT